MSNLTKPKELEMQGKKEFQRKNFQDAANFFKKAAQLYTDLGENFLAAEMSNNWSVAALQNNDGQTAFEAADGTPKVFLAAGNNRLAGMAYGNIGAAQEKLGKIDDALESYQKSADLLREAGDLDARMHVMQSLSALQLQSGHQLQAVATLQAGLDGVSKPSFKQKMLKKLLEVPSNFFSGK